MARVWKDYEIQGYMTETQFVPWKPTKQYRALIVHANTSNVEAWGDTEDEAREAAAIRGNEVWPADLLQCHRCARIQSRVEVQAFKGYRGKECVYCGSQLLP